MIRGLTLSALSFLLPLTAFAALREVRETDEKGAVTRTFYQGDTPVRIETDMNADGKADRTLLFKDGKRGVERGDRNLDGRIDYERLHNAKGRMIQEFQDSNADEKWDKFFTYPFATRDFVLREADRNFDGKIDRRSFSEWDANKSVVIPQGNRMTRTPMPGYSVVWSEDDNDFDGLIDVYANREDKTKDLKGSKMNIASSAPPEEKPEEVQDSGSAVYESESQRRVQELNEKHGYTTQ